MSSKIRTRIAPSPTGFLHLGTARTALFSWAYARHHGGQFVLRIEDTDLARSTQASVDQILASMKWLGLDYDEGPVYQMQRLDRYHAVVEQMIAAGTAYRCYASPEELDAMREALRGIIDDHCQLIGVLAVGARGLVAQQLVVVIQSHVPAGRQVAVLELGDEREAVVDRQVAEGIGRVLVGHDRRPALRLVKVHHALEDVARRAADGVAALVEGVVDDLEGAVGPALLGGFGHPHRLGGGVAEGR